MIIFIDKIVVGNDNYKFAEDLHKRLLEFVVGDELMIKYDQRGSVHEL